MKNLIYYRKNKLYVDKSIHNEWVIKAPTRRHRLARGGSVGLTIDENYDLTHTKKGIVYIDHTAKAYVMIPKDLLGTPEGKTFLGVKNSILRFDIGETINKHSLEIVAIPHAENEAVPYDAGLAAEIRRKFGL